MTALERLGVELARALIEGVDSAPETGDDYLGGEALGRLQHDAHDLLREARRVAKPAELV